jgi:hypothetical protein
MEVSYQLHASAALTPGKQPVVPRKLGGSQSRLALYGEKKYLLPLTGNRIPAVQPVATN